MKNEENKRLNYFGLVLISILIISCQSKFLEKEGCSKYVHENYLAQTADTSLINEVIDCQETLLERFGESSVKGLNHEAYHLQFYSSHGYGKSIKFENKVGGCTIRVKCESKGEWNEECKEYQIEIDEDEWNELEKMIYEFNFWTAEDCRVNKDVLDGYALFLEGNRPQAEKCSKKTNKLVYRGSPRHDKMEALCDNILEYENRLKFKYEQLNKIK